MQDVEYAKQTLVDAIKIIQDPDHSEAFKIGYVHSALDCAYHWLTGKHHPCFSHEPVKSKEL